MTRAHAGLGALAALALLAQGCAVASATAGAAVAVTGAVVATGVSLTGKAIGAGIDAMSSKPDEADGSGIVIRERMAPAPEAAPRCTPITGDAAPAEGMVHCR